MRLLLDTHLLVWAALHPERLSVAAIALIDDSRNELLFSSMSILEIAIKANLERPDFQVDPPSFRDALLNAGYVELELNSDHALAVLRLPPIHKDPFDRALVAQAIVEQVPLVTADKKLNGYPGPISRV